MTDFHERILAWQRASRHAASNDLAAIVHGYCLFLAAEGIVLQRVNLALSTLHPQIQVLRFVWYDSDVDPGPFPSPVLFHRRIHRIDGCTIDEAHLSHGAEDSPQFRKSPFYLLLNGAQRLDYPLTPGTTHAFPVLDDLAARGATHYLAMNLPDLRAHISLATAMAGGFSPGALERIETSLAAFALLLDCALRELILDTVLDCYVGRAPRDEIKHGNIRPGAMLGIEGAIWFSDIRKYSTHTQATEPEAMIARLNAYYDCVATTIYAHGGEVLKFIGDAVLAIFPTGAAGAAAACRSAYAAAAAANRQLEDSTVAFQHGIGLHFGRFRYGNVGTLRRMDFTVIGNEVNVAARIEALCAAHQQPLLMSAAFVEGGAIPAQAFARETLKGIAGEVALFVPAPTTGGADVEGPAATSN
jgi:adenylate cyclase